MQVLTTHRSSSALNHNAPIFVPQAYRTVEDFSDQWWALIPSTPWFRDYWLQECYHDPQYDGLDEDSALPDDLLDSIFFDDEASFLSHSFERDGEETVGENYCRDVVKTGGKKWERRGVQAPKYAEKVPKFVNVKVNPRMIQQPR